MELRFKGIDIKIKNKLLLSGVSGMARKGELLTIMGPSGSGKTTLLNALSGRCKYVNGTVTLDNQPFNKDLKRKIGYVPQKDVFFPYLKLKETLMYTAEIVLPEKLSPDAKLKRVDDVLKILDLTHCSDTVMGDETISGHGLSGGEKKRASIATKLLSNPQILYLDEPTSGLDSTFAFNIMNIMKAYAQQTGKPVVVTIHQPASRIFDAFGNLLVIAMGKMAYFGESHQVVNFFAELDMACAAHFNPGDFILDMVKQDHIQVKRIIEHYENHKNRFWPGEINELEMERNVDEPLHVKKFSIDAQNGPMNSTETIIMTYQDESKKWPTGLWTQLKALTKRSFRQSLYRLTKKTNYLSVLVYIALIGACWFQLDHTERGISDINGMFFFVVTEGNFNVKLNGVLAFTRYKSVIQNERQESMYRLSAYFFSKLASEVFVDNIERLILYSVIYWLVGLTTNAWLFFASLGIYMLGNLVAHAIGIILGIVFKQLDVALTVSLALMVCNMAVGDMLVRQLPYYLRWLKYAAFMKYIIGALLKLEFIYGEPLRCSGVNETRFSECFSNTTNGFIPGDKVCEYLQQTLPLWVDVLVLLVLLLTLYCLTYVALRFIDKPRKINS